MEKPTLKDIDCIGREVMLPVKIVEIFAEGGKITLFGWKDAQENGTSCEKLMSEPW